MWRSIDQDRRPCLSIFVLIWVALSTMAHLSFAGEAAAAGVVAGKLPQGVFSGVNEGTHIRWYLPECWLCDRSRFRVYPMLSVDASGHRNLALHALVLSEAKKGIRLRELDVRLDGVDTSIPLDRDDVEIDPSSCLTAEHATLKGQDDLIRSIGEAREVVVAFQGAKESREYRLTKSDRDSARTFAALSRLETLPIPQETVNKPAAIEGAATVGDQGVVNPEIIRSSKVKPEYPRVARKRKRQGRVVLQLVVEADGSVDRAKVLQSTTCDCGFEDAAIDAVEQWRYTPGRLNGDAVPVYFTVVVDFKLEW